MHVGHPYIKFKEFLIYRKIVPVVQLGGLAPARPITSLLSQDIVMQEEPLAALHEEVQKHKLWLYSQEELLKIDQSYANNALLILNHGIWLLWCVYACRAQYAGEKIPTLQEAIALCKELDLLVIIDVKSNRILVSQQFAYV